MFVGCTPEEAIDAYVWRYRTTRETGGAPSEDVQSVIDALEEGGTKAINVVDIGGGFTGHFRKVARALKHPGCKVLSLDLAYRPSFLHAVPLWVEELQSTAVLLLDVVTSPEHSESVAMFVSNCATALSQETGPFALKTELHEEDRDLSDRVELRHFDITDKEHSGPFGRDAKWHMVIRTFVGPTVRDFPWEFLQSIIAYFVRSGA